ncbi:MAG: UpdY protein, partial [Prevotella sp.]|nr:UpdY protein [Prevotella sp.]
YLSESEAKMKVGAPVLVKYGPLKGLSGKLVRSNKKYYLLKEVPGMGVMLKVSRWCCVPMEG